MKKILRFLGILVVGMAPIALLSACTDAPTSPSIARSAPRLTTNCMGADSIQCLSTIYIIGGGTGGLPTECFFGNCTINCSIYDCTFLGGAGGSSPAGAGPCPYGCSGGGGGGTSGPTPPPPPSMEDLVFSGENYPKVNITAEGLAVALDGCKQDPECLAMFTKLGEIYRVQDGTAAAKALFQQAIGDWLAKMMNNMTVSFNAVTGHSSFSYSPGPSGGLTGGLSFGRWGMPNLAANAAISFNVNTPPPGARLLTGTFTTSPGIGFVFGTTGYPCGAGLTDYCVTSFVFGMASSLLAGGSISSEVPLGPRNP